jgi:hypothetical protein
MTRRAAVFLFRPRNSNILLLIIIGWGFEECNSNWKGLQEGKIEKDEETVYFDLLSVLCVLGG